ncbi:hypothetical protein, partial [Pantoea wallisii]|uniref:hypothetical protein n=1 Tax=Pantoea wallisii TaxID=1076551 RepID=UPI001ABFD134
PALRQPHSPLRGPFTPSRFLTDRRRFAPAQRRLSPTSCRLILEACMRSARGKVACNPPRFNSLSHLYPDIAESLCPRFQAAMR